MASSRPDLRWAAKAGAAAVFCLAGAVAGASLYFGNLAYVRAGHDAAQDSRFCAACGAGHGVWCVGRSHQRPGPVHAATRARAPPMPCGWSRGAASLLAPPSRSR